MSNAGKAVVIVQLKDGSIRLIRAEVVDDEESESGVAVELPFHEDLPDKKDAKRILGNFFHYPDWVTLTDEQVAFCRAWCFDEPQN
jgi:hypothetical protein